MSTLAAFRKQYPVVLSQDVIWGDMDAFEHVNNTVYFRYFEDARLMYFHKLGVMNLKQETKQGPILATTQCNFRLPLKYPDHIFVAARSIILSPRKFRMEYAVYSSTFEAVAAEGDGLLVYYDYANGRSCAIPDPIVEAIRLLESGR